MIWACTIMRGLSTLHKSTGRMWRTLQKIQPGWSGNYKRKLHKSRESKNKTSNLFWVSQPNNNNWTRPTSKKWPNWLSARPKSRSDYSSRHKNKKSTVSKSCSSKISLLTCANNCKKRMPHYSSSRALLTSTTGWESCIWSSEKSWWKIIETAWPI